MTLVPREGDEEAGARALPAEAQTASAGQEEDLTGTRLCWRLELRLPASEQAEMSGAFYDGSLS